MIKSNSSQIISRKSTIKQEIMPYYAPLPIPTRDNLEPQRSNSISNLHLMNPGTDDKSYLNRKIADLQKQLQWNQCEKTANQIYRKQFKEIGRLLGNQKLNFEDMQKKIENLQNRLNKSNIYTTDTKELSNTTYEAVRTKQPLNLGNNNLQQQIVKLEDNNRQFIQLNEDLQLQLVNKNKIIQQITIQLEQSKRKNSLLKKTANKSTSDASKIIKQEQLVKQQFKNLQQEHINTQQLLKQTKLQLKNTQSQLKNLQQQLQNTLEQLKNNKKQLQQKCELFEQYEGQMKVMIEEKKQIAFSFEAQPKKLSLKSSKSDEVQEKVKIIIKEKDHLEELYQKNLEEINKNRNTIFAELQLNKKLNEEYQTNINELVQEKHHLTQQFEKRAQDAIQKDILNKQYHEELEKANNDKQQLIRCYESKVDSIIKEKQEIILQYKQKIEDLQVQQQIAIERKNGQNISKENSKQSQNKQEIIKQLQNQIEQSYEQLLQLQTELKDQKEISNTEYNKQQQLIKKLYQEIQNNSQTYLKHNNQFQNQNNSLKNAVQTISFQKQKLSQKCLEFEEQIIRLEVLNNERETKEQLYQCFLQKYESLKNMKEDKINSMMQSIQEKCNNAQRKLEIVDINIEKEVKRLLHKNQELEVKQKNQQNTVHSYQIMIQSQKDRIQFIEEELQRISENVIPTMNKKQAQLQLQNQEKQNIIEKLESIQPFQSQKRKKNEKNLSGSAPVSAHQTEKASKNRNQSKIIKQSIQKGKKMSDSIKNQNSSKIQNSIKNQKSIRNSEKIQNSIQNKKQIKNCEKRESFKKKSNQVEINQSSIQNSRKLQGFQNQNKTLERKEEFISNSAHSNSQIINADHSKNSILSEKSSIKEIAIKNQTNSLHRSNSKDRQQDQSSHKNNSIYKSGKQQKSQQSIRYDSSRKLTESNLRLSKKKSSQEYQMLSKNIDVMVCPSVDLSKEISGNKKNRHPMEMYNKKLSENDNKISERQFHTHLGEPNLSNLHPIPSRIISILMPQHNLDHSPNSLRQIIYSPQQRYSNVTPIYTANMDKRQNVSIQRQVSYQNISPNNPSIQMPRQPNIPIQKKIITFNPVKTSMKPQVSNLLSKQFHQSRINKLSQSKINEELESNKCRKSSRSKNSERKISKAMSNSQQQSGIDITQQKYGLNCC